MTTLTIRIPDTETQKISNYIEDLRGEIVAYDSSKDELKQEIKEAVEEMKLIKSGKKKARNAEDFLNELKCQND